MTDHLTKRWAAWTRADEIDCFAVHGVYLPWGIYTEDEDPIWSGYDSAAPDDDLITHIVELHNDSIAKKEGTTP
jgi:hypothetical protein